MNSKMKLIAGPAKVSVRMLTVAEIKAFGLDELKSPLTYGLVTSIGWNFVHTTEGLIVIFDMSTAIKLFSDTYIIEEKSIIAKFIRLKEIQDPFLTGSSSHLSNPRCHLDHPEVN